MLFEYHVKFIRSFLKSVVYYHLFMAFLLACQTTLFLPERDYVTLGYMLSEIRLSVCRLSVTFVHPIQLTAMTADLKIKCNVFFIY